MSHTKRTDEKLWARIKREVTRSSKGGLPGKWSARKAQLAVQKYKKSGGRYKGKKSPRNSLVKWTREKWDYISPSGRKTKRGRYLPEKVRKSLTPSEKRRENRLKGSKRGRKVSYSPSVVRKMRKSGVLKR